jgi:hypothetical protein
VAHPRNEVDQMTKQRLRVGLALLLVVTGTSLMGAASAAPVGPVDSDEKGPVTLPSTTFFNNFNSGGVVNQPRTATTFTLAASAVVTTVQTYHWNNGHGKTPGTIKLVSSSGKSFRSDDPGGNLHHRRFGSAHLVQQRPVRLSRLCACAGQGWPLRRSK